VIESVERVAGGREKRSPDWQGKEAIFSCFSGPEAEENGTQRQRLLRSKVSRVRVPSPAPDKFGCHEDLASSWPKERARSSVAERPAHNRLVVGSNPAGPTSQ
jgi:hypothetical protein